MLVNCFEVERFLVDKLFVRPAWCPALTTYVLHVSVTLNTAGIIGAEEGDRIT